MGSRLLSGTLAAALVVAPLHMAFAGPVEDLYTQGQEKFDAGDYGSAGDLWAEAVRAVEEGPDSAMRQTLMNLSLDAYLRAYQADKDRAHIDDAKALLDEYEAMLAGTDVALSPEIANEKQKIDDILAELDTPVEPADTGDEDEGDEDDDGGDDGSVPIGPPPKPGKVLVITGGALTGVGAAGIGILLVGVLGGISAQTDYNSAEDGSDEQAAAESRGKTMNALAITGGVVAPVFLGAGIALLVVGLKQNKQAAEAHRTALVPTFGPNYAGFSLSGRF